MPMSVTYFKSALVAYVVITLVRHVSKASATEEMEMLKQVDEGESLVMDINWVIQMASFGFSGFFCELLGLSSGLKAVFPELRVTKALARNALVEPLVGREGADIRKENEMTVAFFDQELMEKESDDLKWLTDPVQVPRSSRGEGNQRLLPYPKFASIYEISQEGACIKSTMTETETLPKPGNELSRTYDAEARTSAEECCRACELNPLCTFWSYAPYDMGPYAAMIGEAGHHEFKCQLGARQYVKGREREGAHSGVMTRIAQEVSLTGEATKTGTSRLSAPRAVIFHGTMCMRQNLTLYHEGSSKRDANEIRIGRYMFERASFSKGMNQDELSVVSCASHMDEVWVPTVWHQKAFYKILHSLGGPKMASSISVAVIPEAVDVGVFDPSLVRSRGEGNPFRSRSRLPEDLCWVEGWPDDRRGRVRCAQSDSTTSAGAGADTDTDTDTGAGGHTGGENRFEYLSVFKWERRKGWDLLLDAYWGTFDRHDQVVLRLRTYVPPWEVGMDADINHHLESYAHFRFGRSASELAPVVWEYGRNASLLSDSLSRADVRDLLASADAFVLPSRGEGWGLPIAEAMAMRVPTIVSACPGPRAFATEDNAYLIPGEEAGPDSEDGYFEPDSGALADLMRQAVHDSGPQGGGRALEKTAQARADMADMSPVRVAALMAARLRAAGQLRGWEF